MKHQQKLLAPLLILLFLFLAGCTQAITGTWKKPTYNETIKKFLVTSDDKQLIFIGDKHHYIFSNHGALTAVLQWKHRNILEAELDSTFSLDKSNSISGSYRVTCKCLNVTVEQMRWLERSGFKKSISNNNSSQSEKYKYTLKGRVGGKRYLSNNLNLDRYASLNNKYRITIEEDFTSLGTLKRVALTPIAIAADGAASIGLVSLLVISIPFNVAHQIME